MQKNQNKEELKKAIIYYVERLENEKYLWSLLRMAQELAKEKIK